MVGGLVALAAIVFYPYDVRVGLMRSGSWLGMPLSELFTSSGSARVPPGYAAIEIGTAASPAPSSGASVTPRRVAPQTAPRPRGSTAVQTVVTLDPSKGWPEPHGLPSTEMVHGFRPHEPVTINCVSKDPTRRVVGLILPFMTNWTITFQLPGGGTQVYDAVDHNEEKGDWRYKDDSYDIIPRWSDCERVTLTHDHPESLEVKFYIKNRSRK